MHSYTTEISTSLKLLDAKLVDPRLKKKSPSIDDKEKLLGKLSLVLTKLISIRQRIEKDGAIIDVCRKGLYNKIDLLKRSINLLIDPTYFATSAKELANSEKLSLQRAEKQLLEETTNNLRLNQDQLNFLKDYLHKENTPKTEKNGQLRWRLTPQSNQSPVNNSSDILMSQLKYNLSTLS